MSRKVLEDCLKKVPNKFELVLLAIAHARGVNMRGGVVGSVSSSGDSEPTLRHSYARQRPNKAPYTALSDIALSRVLVETLKEDYVQIYDRTGSLREVARKSLDTEKTFAQTDDAQELEEGVDASAADSSTEEIAAESDADAEAVGKESSSDSEDPNADSDEQ